MCILELIYDIPFIGKPLFKMIVMFEGGPQESESLRRLAKRKFKVEVGMFSYGDCFSNKFNNGGEVTIGMYCSFASSAVYFGGNHPMDHVSMSPYFYNKSFGMNERNIIKEKMTVGNDVWCEHNALIVSECKELGNGTDIGAGSVVTKDAPVYAILLLLQGIQQK
jgi:virginiamycin A acetyltransferase